MHVGEELGQRLDRLFRLQMHQGGLLGPDAPGFVLGELRQHGVRLLQVASQLQSAQRELAPLRRHQGPDASDRLQESSPVNGFKRLADRGQLARLGRDRRGLGPGLRRDAQAHQAAVGQEEH